MSNLGSSVVILSPSIARLNVEVDYAQFDQIESELKRPNRKVVVIDAKDIFASAGLETIKSLFQRGDGPRLILFNGDLLPINIRVEFFNHGNLMRCISDANAKEIEQALQDVLHELRNLEQHSELVRLVKNNNEELRKAYKELEDRISKRTTELNQSRVRLQSISRRETALQQGLLAIFKGRSLGEIENFLLQNLKADLNLDLVRIFHLNQDQLSLQKERLVQSFSVFETPLFHLHDKIGVIYFLRDRELPFSRADQDFLQKLAEAVALALHRLEALMESEALNIQWQATFNALSEPVGIISRNFEILQANQAFLDKSKHNAETIMGVKCYEALFRRTSPCENCRLGEKFILRENRDNRTYDVSSQSVSFVTEEDEVYVHLYRDITDQQRLEKQLLESTKLAELGIIGSSIAHELNNPVGGILSFAQLIKMDIDSKDSIYEDICEIENGARRCKEIIQNLLSFSRDPAVDRIEDIDLRDVISRAIKIIELKTRSKGIQIIYKEPPLAISFKGHFNLLSQALQNILQNSLESLVTYLKTQPKSFHATIEIQLRLRDEFPEIIIEDNGPGISPEVLEKVKEPLFTTKDPTFNPGLGLSLAERIIADHGGRLDIQSTPYSKTSVLISFSGQALSL